VAEAAVVGAADETTGEAVVAFVILRGEEAAKDTIVEELRAHVGKEIGPIAKPRTILVVPELPKTRSGKLLRRSIQALAEGRDPGDLTTIEDPAALEQIRRILAIPYKKTDTRLVT
jgi:acetyl-CoA synthetase